MSSRPALLLMVAFGSAACANSASTAASPTPSPAVQGVVERAAAAQPTPPAPPPPPVVKDIDPVGTYSVSLTSQGNPLTITAKIERRTDGTYGGTVVTGVTPMLPITSVKVSGKSMKVSVTGPNGEEAIMNLTLDGDQLSGDWAMGNDGSALSGRKLP